jgi:hypothetical protein
MERFPNGEDPYPPIGGMYINPITEIHKVCKILA